MVVSGGTNSTPVMHPVLIAKLIILLSVANGTPVVLKRAFGKRWSQPIDGGLVLPDGQRLFGPSKTIRGVLGSIAVTAVTAPALDLEPAVGALAGVAAIVGDLFSSFVKRRWGFAPSTQAMGLDQIPEALLPVLACSFFLPISATDLVVTVAGFSVGAIVNAGEKMHRRPGVTMH